MGGPRALEIGVGKGIRQKKERIRGWEVISLNTQQKRARDPMGDPMDP